MWALHREVCSVIPVGVMTGLGVEPLATQPIWAVVDLTVKSACLSANRLVNLEQVMNPLTDQPYDHQ